MSKTSFCFQISPLIIHKLLQSINPEQLTNHPDRANAQPPLHGRNLSDCVQGPIFRLPANEACSTTNLSIHQPPAALTEAKPSSISNFQSDASPIRRLHYN